MTNMKVHGVCVPLVVVNQPWDSPQAERGLRGKEPFHQPIEVANLPSELDCRYVAFQGEALFRQRPHSHDHVPNGARRNAEVTCARDEVPLVRSDDAGLTDSGCLNQRSDARDGSGCSIARVRREDLEKPLWGVACEVY
jgi:hypothetical protein